jgi:Ca2+-binding EF-hand superfamily protein
MKYKDFLDFLGFSASSAAALLNVEDQTDDVADRLRRKISRSMKQGADMAKVFSRMDRDGNGEVEIDEFKEALKGLGIPLSLDEAKKIISRFAPNGRSIKFKDFLVSFVPPSSSGDEQDRQMVDMLVGRMRHLMEDRLGGKTNPARRLKEAFARFDRNGDGKISHREFKDGMTDLKIDLSRGETEQVLRRFDADNSGFLDYGEFMDLLQFDTGELLSPKETTALVEKIRRKLEDDLGSEANSARRIKEVFSDIDVDGSNSINQQELVEALRALKIRLKGHEASSILAKFGDEKTGEVRQTPSFRNEEP